MAAMLIHHTLTVAIFIVVRAIGIVNTDMFKLLVVMLRWGTVEL